MLTGPNFASLETNKIFFRVQVDDTYFTKIVIENISKTAVRWIYPYQKFKIHGQVLVAKV